MATTGGMEWGWFFLRVGVGVYYLLIGLHGVNHGGVELDEVAQVVAGGAALLGLLVRPGALFLLLAMAWLTVSSGGVKFHLNTEAVAPFLFVVGLLVGGGGTVLAVGAMIDGFNGKWWQ